jgi:hypothetical protein
LPHVRDGSWHSFDAATAEPAVAIGTDFDPIREGRAKPPDRCDSVIGYSPLDPDCVAVVVRTER